MIRKYCTYSHEIAPGLLLTVEAELRTYRENGQIFVDDFYLEGAKLSVFGEEVDLLKGCPHNREAVLWLDEVHPEKARLVDLAMDKGKVKEIPLMERAA